MHLLLPYVFSNSSISRAAISTLLIFLMSVFVIVGTGDKFSSLELYSICFSSGYFAIYRSVIDFETAWAMLSSMYERSTPAWLRLVAKLWRHQVPDGLTSQWRTSWQTFITRSCILEFSLLTRSLISFSLVTPFNIWGKTGAFSFGGAPIYSTIRRRGSIMDIITSELFLLRNRVFFR